MGVNGLTSYVMDRKKQLLKRKKLRNCKLVIDGNSLCAQLAKETNCRAAFGGDYCHYGRNLAAFYKLLKECNIQPIILMDGCCEKRKIHTTLERVASRLREARNITPIAEHGKVALLFPALLKNTFVQVTLQEGLPLVCCPQEADPLLAALAKKLHCPLLSLDSDFFIAEVEYVPFTELKKKIMKDSDGNYLECQACPSGAFAASLRISPQCLPILATLLGNDYVKRFSFAPFLRNLQMTSGGKNDLGKRRVAGLVRWLRNETLETAIEKVLNRFKKERRDRIKTKIQNSLAAYSEIDYNILNALNLSDIIDDEFPNENVEDVCVEEDEETLEESDSEVNEELSDSEIDEVDESDDDFNISPRFVPDWAKVAMENGSVSPYVFDLVHGSFYISNPQVEDFNKPDSFICTFPILRFSHALITGNPNADIRYEGRRGFERSSINIPRYADDNIQLFAERPPVSLFFNFLNNNGIDKKFLESLVNYPSDSQLFLLAISWMKQSKDCELTSTDAYTLLLSFLTSAVITRKLNEWRLYRLELKYSEKIKTLKKSKPEIVTISSEDYPKDEDVTLDDAILAGSILLKNLELNSNLLNSVRLYKRQYLHSFAQFQNCLQQLSYLNALFGNPLKTCNFRYAYSGPCIYNIYVNLRKRPYPGSYIYQLLQLCPSVLKYFVIMAQLLGFEDCIPPNCATQHTSVKSKKRGKKKSNSLDENDEVENKNEPPDVEDECYVIHDVNNKFSILSIT